MDGQAFNLKMVNVSLEEGQSELKSILEACGIGEAYYRSNVKPEGKGNGMYNKVIIETDDGALTWYRSLSKKKNKKNGTLMIEGEPEFFFKVMEKIMWRSRAWLGFRKEKKILVLDDKMTVPAARKKVWIVAVSDVEGEVQKRTQIFNGFRGEQQLLEWKREGCIVMGFLGLADTREW